MLHTYIYSSCILYHVIIILFDALYTLQTSLLICSYISICVYYNIFEMYYMLTKCLYTLYVLVLHAIYTYLYRNYTYITLLKYT